jgi:hypothetical protein
MKKSSHVNCGPIPNLSYSFLVLVMFVNRSRRYFSRRVLSLYLLLFKRGFKLAYFGAFMLDHFPTLRCRSYFPNWGGELQWSESWLEASGKRSRGLQYPMRLLAFYHLIASHGRHIARQSYMPPPVFLLQASRPAGFAVGRARFPCFFLSPSL